MTVLLTHHCHLHGALRVHGTRYVWDYAADAPVPAVEMPPGGARWKASERARGAGQVRKAVTR